MNFSIFIFFASCFITLLTASPFESFNDENDEIVLLNVGGTKIDISKEIINSAGDESTLYTLFNGPMKKYTRDREGRIFLQRDPQTFQMLLNYLMGYDVLGGKASLEERWVRMLYQEADYWFVERLLKEIEQLPELITNMNDYYGGIKDFKRHGFGYKQDSNYRYAGQFQNDEFHGKGILKHERNGEHYEGDFENGKYHGEGVLKYWNGEYKGQFRDGLKEGKGTLKYRNGDFFEGQFRHNRESQGKLITDKGVYEGSFVNGYIRSGTLKNKNGDRFTGSFRSNLMNGGEMDEGEMQFSDGKKFKGSFFNNQMYNGVLYPDSEEKGHGIVVENGILRSN